MTSTTQPRILIIGGGIGGLCLAQGLRRAGVPVTVHERTRARTDWLQGYRIHINPRGSRALRDCLDPANWQTFVDTVSTVGGGFAFVTEHLRTLVELDEELVNKGSTDPADRHHGVSRITLREVLLNGMSDVVRFGSTFQRYETTPDGRVTAYFEDGTSDTADLLVGADGANSRVRGQLLPHAHRVDTGVLAVAGKYRLTDASRRELPAELTTRANNVLPLGPGSLFTAVWSGDRRTAAVPTTADSGLLYDPTADYAFWGYADEATRFPDSGRLDGYTGERLRQVVLDRIRRWSPDLRRLVAGSDPDTVNVVRIRSASPVDPWPTGPVTLLGDAIHNMTPMAGIGANTALRDADLLRRQLIAVRDGGRALAPAVAEYERQMLDYGFAAVRLSLRNARQAGSANPVARAAFRGLLRTAGAVPALKRRMFADIGN
ncbi:FAD-dependent oxidoreductase [Micromonospora zhanjiangensis]|uniref:FAD-dependent oxidoreductase n=1 Tax=Micromonospora zhanjiangensis TaxID=1522057 RepID=A0ABV8KWU7_9ACTN